MSRSNYIRSLFSKQSGKESRKANAYKPRTTIEIRRLSRNAALFLRLSAMKTASCFFKKTRKRKLLCLLPRRVRSRFSRIRRSRRRIRRFTLFARSLCRTVRLYTRHLCSSVIRANMRRLSYMSSLVNVNAHVTPCSSTTQRVMSGPGPRKYPQLNMTQKRTYSRNINITKKAEHMRTESVTLLEAREVFSYNFFASVYVHTTPRTKWQLIKASLLDGSVDCIFKASRIHKIDVASRSTTCSEKTVTTSKLEEYRKVRATADFQ
jgi:hypothetical protein